MTATCFSEQWQRRGSEGGRTCARYMYLAVKEDPEDKVANGVVSAAIRLD